MPTPEYLPGPLETDATIATARDKVEERRTLVWEMMMQGASSAHMARELGHPRMVIDADVYSIKRALGEHVGTLRSSKDAVHQEIGEMMARLDWIFHNAVMEYSAVGTPGGMAGAAAASNKNKFLNTAMKAVQTKSQILVATGYLPKAGVRVTIEGSDSASFAAMFGKAGIALDDPVKRRKAIEVASRILSGATTAAKMGLEGPDDEDEDADAE